MVAHDRTPAIGTAICMKSLILDPKKFMRLNAGLTVFWIVMIPIAVVTGWINSVAFIAAVSIYALVAAHLSTYAAARTEVLQAEAGGGIRETVQRLQKLDKGYDRDEVDGE